MSLSVHFNSVKKQVATECSEALATVKSKLSDLTQRAMAFCRSVAVIPLCEKIMAELEQLMGFRKTPISDRSAQVAGEQNKIEIDDSESDLAQEKTVVEIEREIQQLGHEIGQLTSRVHRMGEQSVELFCGRGNKRQAARMLADIYQNECDERDWSSAKETLDTLKASMLHYLGEVDFAKNQDQSFARLIRDIRMCSSAEDLSLIVASSKCLSEENRSNLLRGLPSESWL